MFLDDKLYTHFNSRSINTADDANTMLRELIKICDNYKSDNLPLTSIPEPRVVKATLDRIFKQWDSFVDKLKKDKHYLASIYEQFSYRNMWMRDEKLAKLYNDLSRML